MNGRAPKFPLTGSQAWVTKNPSPNFEIDIRDRMINSNRINATMAKIASAQVTIRPAKTLSIPAELPRDCRKARIWETSGGDFGDPGAEDPDESEEALTPGGPATRTS